MILTKTPLRVSFFGGGSDLPEYFSSGEHGAVISTTIDVHMYIALNTSPRNRVKVCYDEIEIVDDSSSIKHNRVRETLLQYGVKSNVEIASFCNVPTKGTGLGSSSSYTVGLCKALDAFKSIARSSHELADIAYNIERIRCNESLGCQDQYAAAFGGFNLYEFNDREVEVIKLNSNVIETLEQNLMYFFTGSFRVANDILEKVANNNNADTLGNMVSLTYDAFDAIKNSKVHQIGELLDQTWTLKKMLADSVSNSTIDEYYDIAKRNGALGGKILGAGGGGFLMLYVPYTYQYRVRQALQSTGMKEYMFKFSDKGSEVIVND